MNKKQWVALLILYVGYLMFGALVFYFLEKDEEEIRRREELETLGRINNTLGNCSEKNHLLRDLEKFCGKPINENGLTPRIWDFYNSVFFVITVVSTIGYGNLHPTTTLSRLMMIFYAVIGIPLNGILLTSLAQFFSNVFVRAHKKYKRYESRFGLAVDILTYLIPGILLFIFLPALAFVYFEEWKYDEGVYYAFVTLTTIGFGDIVAGQRAFVEHDHNLIIAYKALLLCWIVFGLGYLIMLLGFVTRAMRSKKMMNLEHKLVEALTHSKIWHGFSKDVNYLRRIMNELYLDRFKPVFQDEDESHKQVFPRSKSLPNISLGMDDDSILEEIQYYKRKRANSDYIPSKLGISRVFSENDLFRIDRRATFATACLIQPCELLRHVVDAMGGSMAVSQDLSHHDEPRGVNVFSDEEILQSEQWYGKSNNSVPSLHHPPSYEDVITPRRARSRAYSECPVPRSNGQAMTSTSNLRDSEWTWSGAGANKIHEIVNERHKRNLLRENEKNKSKNISSSVIAGAKWLNPLRKRRKFLSESQDETGSKTNIYTNGDIKFNIEDGKEQKYTLNVPTDLNRKRRSLQDGNLPKLRQDNHYITHTAGTGMQGLGLMHNRQGLARPEEDLLTLFSGADHLFGDENQREILEETSLADFLRVLTSLHNRVGERLMSEDFKPKRKLGTASLTPPRISSLLNLFPPEPEPKSPTKRKFSLMPNLFNQNSSRRNSLRPNSPPSTSITIPNDEAGTSTERPMEPSNLKRLGRFLLRSYSLTPKTDSNPDVSLIHRDSYRLKNKKKFSLKPNESPLASSSNQDVSVINCPIKIQIDSPTSSIHSGDKTWNATELPFPNEPAAPFAIPRSNTVSAIVSEPFGSRRGSSPASVIDANPFLRDRFRSASSSESVFAMSGSRRLPYNRQVPSPRMRRAKPNLSDVKEVQK